MRIPTRLRRAPNGLAPRLVALVVLVALLASGSVAVSVISSARAALRDQILQTHLVMADLVGGRSAEYVTDVESDANDLADRPEVRLAFERNNFSDLGTELTSW